MNWKHYLDGHYLAHAQSAIWDNDSMPVLHFKVKEKLYEPYEIEAVVVLEASESNPIFQGMLDNSMLGQTICIGLGGSDLAFRTFVGELGDFRYEGVTSQDSLDNTIVMQYVYRIWLYPKLWKLKFDERLRIFANQEKRTIISNILQENAIEVVSEMVATNLPVEMSAQYHENSLNYLIRLMQESGVVAYFDSALQIGSTDDPSVAYADTLPVYTIVENTQNCAEFSLSFLELRIGHFDFGEIIDFTLKNTSKVNQYSLYDYNFQTPETQIFAQSIAPTWVGNITERYPNRALDAPSATKMAQTLTARDATNQTKFEAITTSYQATPGRLLTITDCAASEINKTYFIEEVEHVLENIENKWTYRNYTKGVLKGDKYTPEITKIKPKIHGQQTAIVVGTSDNTQVNVDTFGRVQVRFMWIHGDSDEDKGNHITKEPSAWIRVMQWGNAGSSWGNYNLPRVGQEVVVGFLNGDVDTPVVLGSVYNTSTNFAYPMPVSASMLVLKTQTTGELGKLGDRYNEFKMIDEELAELVSLRAQKNAEFNILNDCLTEIGNDDIKLVKGNMVLELPNGDRIERIGGSSVMPGDVTAGTMIAAEFLNDTIDMLTMKKGIKMTHIESGAFIVLVDSGDMSFAVPKGLFNGTFSSLNFLTKGNYSTEAGGDYSIKVLGDSSMKVIGDHNESVSGVYSLNVTGDYTHKVEGNLSITSIGTAEITGDSITVTGLGDINMEAVGMISLKAGTLNIDAGEITLTGGMISATSGAVFEITAGAMVQIKGAMVQIN